MIKDPRKATVGDMLAAKTKIGRIWQYLYKHPKATVLEIAQVVSLHPDNINSALAYLRKYGWVERVRSDRPTNGCGQPPYLYSALVGAGGESKLTRIAQMKKRAEQGYTMEAIAKEFGLSVRRCTFLFKREGVRLTASLSVARTARIRSATVDAKVLRIAYALGSAVPSEDQLAALLDAKPGLGAIEKLLDASSQTQVELRAMDKQLNAYKVGDAK